MHLAFRVESWLSSGQRPCSACFVPNYKSKWYYPERVWKKGVQNLIKALKSGHLELKNMKGCALNWTVLCQRQETFLETSGNSSSSFDPAAKITLTARWIQMVFKRRHQNMSPHSILWNTHRTVKSHWTVGSAHGALHCGTNAISVIAVNSALMAVCSVGWYRFFVHC